jgi:hypothetical protein
MKNRNHCILFFVIIGIVYSAIYSKNKINENSFYFVAPVMGKDPISKMLGPQVRIEMQEDGTFPWVGYDIDTMMRSKISMEMYSSDSLPSDIQAKLLQNKINYLILPFISASMSREITQHLEIFPALGVTSGGVHKITAHDYFDTTRLSLMLIDVKSNIIIKKHSEVIRQEMVDGDMTTGIKDRIFELVENGFTLDTHEAAIIDSTSISSATGLNRSGKVLFVIGSILTSVGFGTEITSTSYTEVSTSDRSEMTNSSDSKTSNAAYIAGVALYAAGHTGLLTCGLSTIPLNRSVKSLYGENIQGIGNGWIYYGISIITNTAGFIIMNRGSKKNNEALEYTGLVIGISGEIMRIPAWISFLKTRNKASRSLKRFSSPNK